MSNPRPGPKGVYDWHDEDNIRTLLACKTMEEMVTAFPLMKASTLKARKSDLIRSHPDLVATTSYGTRSEIPSDMVAKHLLTAALRKLDAYRDKRAEYVHALQEAIFEAVQEIVIDPPKAVRPKAKNEDAVEEICVAMLSDVQLGKVTVDYDSDVAIERVQRLAEKTVRLARIQNSDHPVRTIHVQLIGDIVEGEGIFPHQAHELDSGLYRQVGVNGPALLSGYLLTLLTFFDTVHVTAVIGNHGNLKLVQGATDPESNMDRLLYRVVQLMFRDEPRITWDIPDGVGLRNWYAVDRVFDWGFLLAHGDQIRGGFAGFPWYGTAKKAWGWIDAIEEPWDFLHFGHYHTPTMMTLNRRVARCNGSTESSNAYAQEQLSAVGFPTQWVGFVHPEMGVTSEYWVRLDEGRQPAKRRQR